MQANDNMRKIAFLILVISCSFRTNAQTDSVEKIFAFKITDYINPLNDSTSLVQIVKPASVPLNIKEKQMAVLYHCYKNGEILDTAIIGWSKCQLIKGDYYYFSVHLNGSQVASGGDLLYANLKMPYVYDGLLLNIMNRAIQFNNVYELPFMSNDAIFTNSKKNESDVLDSMISDIRFTGKAMLQQMPAQNKVVESGIYKGQKLLEAMQKATRADLESFLKYVAARPTKYAGNTWKISETYATWMAAGTPTVVGD